MSAWAQEVAKAAPSSWAQTQTHAAPVPQPAHAASGGGLGGLASDKEEEERILREALPIDERARVRPGPVRTTLMEDPSSAHARLRGRFEIVDKHGKGDAPNALTIDEYLRMVELYERISRGQGDLTMDTSELKGKEKEDTQAGMMENLVRMMQTGAGRQILTKLSNNVMKVDGKSVHRRTSLRGFHADANGDGDRTNDESAPLSSEGQAMVVPKDRDEAYRDGDDRGDGSDATVLFNPGMRVPGSRSDVVLAHELVHALQFTQGLGDSTVVSAEEDEHDHECGVNRNEHMAVGTGHWWNKSYTENAYRAERKLIGQAHGRGVIDGDEAMSLRNSYVSQTTQCPKD